MSGTELFVGMLVIGCIYGAYSYFKKEAEKRNKKDT